MGICHWDRGLITAPETPEKNPCISSEVVTPSLFIFHIIIASIGRGNEKLCFYSNQIRTLVAMATYSSHRLNYNGKRGN